MENIERRTIVGHRQYEVSEYGDIYRIAGTRRSGPDDKLSLTAHRVRGSDDSDNAYLYCSLNTRDHVQRNVESGELETIDILSGRHVSVHRIVCRAWHGEAPEGKPWVNHKDGNKRNNHYSNLEWSSISDNIKHAYEVLGRKKYSGKDHWLFGKKSKASTKKLQSVSKIGELHPKFKGWYVKDGIEYASAIIASKAVKGASQKQVLRWTAKNQNGWSFKSKDQNSITILSPTVNYSDQTSESEAK